jgi:hypothetical protein
MTPAAIVRRLNCEGFRIRRNVTRSGPNAGREGGRNPWTRRRVYDTLTCSVYVGVEAVPRGSGALEGHHPALVDPETFDRVQRSLPRATRRPTGRPRRGGRGRDTLLAGLATCSRCVRGDRRLATRRRKPRPPLRLPERARRHGSLRRAAGRRRSVEPFFVAPLRDFLVDLDAWIAARAAQTDRDRELFANGAQEQRAELARLGRRAEAACAQHDRLLDQGDDELADTRRGARTRVSVRRLPRCPRGPRPVGGCRGRGRPAEPATLSQVQATALDSALTHVLRRRT